MSSLDEEINRTLQGLAYVGHGVAQGIYGLLMMHYSFEDIERNSNLLEYQRVILEIPVVVNLFAAEVAAVLLIMYGAKTMLQTYTVDED